MGRYISVEKYVDIDVDLDDFEDEDIIEEAERRGLAITGIRTPGDNRDLLQQIFEKRRTGQNFDYELDTLIYNGLGRII